LENPQVMLHVLNKAASSDKSRILKIVRKRTKSTTDIREVSEFVEANGGFKYAEEVMYSFNEKAIAQLSGYPDSEVKTALIEYVNYITSRTS